MISPQPFMEPRGAPFCVHQHVQSLLEQGYQVDLVTYPIGKDVQLPNLTIYRAPMLPGIRSVKPGASFAKIPLDIAVFFTAFWRLCLRRYRYIHTHEEAALMGIVLKAIFGGKHLYYMHCDLSQLVPQHPLLVSLVAAVQQFMIRKADTIIAFYPDIAMSAQRKAPHTPVYTILPPAVDEGLPAAREEDVAQLRHTLSLEGHPVLLYTGTLENYQGLDILLRSVVRVQDAFPDARYVIVGGKPEQVADLRVQAQQLGVLEAMRFVGQRPLEEMPTYMALADVLLSPRSKGTHTPLKLYTYLRSGKSILATDVLSHTQVLTSEIAMLVPSTEDGLVEGALELLRHPEQARILGKRGQAYAEEHYSWPVFIEKSSQVQREFVSVR